jgi:hypothetical protein
MAELGTTDGSRDFGWHDETDTIRGIVIVYYMLRMKSLFYAR